MTTKPQLQIKRSIQDMIFGAQFYAKFKRHLKTLQVLEYRVNAKRQVNLAFKQSNTPPILIYQMGKVGSSTVYNSLKKTLLSDSVLFLHFLSDDLSERKKKQKQAGRYPLPYHFYLAEATRKSLEKYQGRTIKIISLLRDPIAFIVSNLFQNPDLAGELILTDKGEINPEKAKDFINRELCRLNAFRYVYEWFDRELKTVFDIDVFAKSFPVEAGYAMYSKGNVEALVIRLEDLSEKGPKVISDFLGLDEQIILEKNNVRIDTSGADVYRDVLNNLSLDSSMCSEIYSSKFVKNFYSEAIIEKLMIKWTQLSSLDSDDYYRKSE